MPEEGVTDIVKIVNFITIVAFFKSLIVRCLNDRCRKDSSLEIDSVCYIDFTVIDKVMSPFEIFDNFLK